MKRLFLFLCAAGVALGQYKLESAGAPPVFTDALQATGYKIVSDAGAAVCTIWFAKSLPAGGAKEEGVSLSIPHGALLGAIEFPARGSDRRGQSIKPGVYTLRYSIYPQDGAHMGVAPQRDFAILVPAEMDKDPAARPAYEQLMPLSGKASGTSHPAILSIAPSPAEKFPSLSREERDWMLHVKVGETGIAVLVIGKFEG